MSKKILIVTKFFHPDITPRAFRAFELAKEFSRQGHDVTVLTTEREFDYSDLENEYGICVQATVKNEPAQIQGDGIKRVFRFILDWLFLYPSIQLIKNFSKVLKAKYDYDLLVSIAYPYSVHFGVALAKENNKMLCKTWVADCGDPFVGNGENRLRMPFYFKWLEQWFCKQPDFITVPIIEAKYAYPKECQNRIKIIPQGFDFTEIKPNYNVGFNKVPTFSYAGMLGAGTRDPRPLLNLLCELNQDFRFVIYTKNYSLISSYQKKLGKKLEIKEYVPRNELLNFLGKMDFLINFENKNEVQKPSKLIDYAVLQRPILSIKPFEVDRVILEEFLEGNYKNSYKVNNVESFDIKCVANDFIALCWKD